VRRIESAAGIEPGTLSAMDLGLTGKVAIVAASSRGLGWATARRLAEEGASVVMCSRIEQAITDAAAQIAREVGAGAQVVGIQADVTQPRDAEALVQTAVDRFGGLHVLVNNAGGPPAGTFLQFDDDAWRRAFELNFLSTARLSRLAVPHMQRRGGGRIINITSYVVKQPGALLVLSNAIRTAVIGLAKSMANELGPMGITVNSVGPGRIATERVQELDQAAADRQGTSADVVRANWEKTIPVGHYGKPADIGDVVAFLASENASFVTGTTIQVDGGLVQALL
jgi:3-oxoacyl-[acyl-carrier protein] reductase